MALSRPNNPWWDGGIIYQIYPRSYQDSNGDGIGDLAGITQRLDHVASLGVDAVWVSPFFTSPMKDFGYDVSDYRDIDPIFGNLADFDAMLARAHDLGLKVMIDLVLSHSSDQHEWFVQSRQNKHNDKANWYVWADAKQDGTPPNNWLSIFGGSAWQWDPRREQYYLHNFLSSQPDLNFHEPQVQDALLDVAKFWLDRGVDGFRLDTINFYFHDAQLRDNPPLSEEDRTAIIAPSVNPYNHQDHLYSKNRPENLAFLERLRALCDQYEDRACLGEVGDAHRGLEIMGEYTSGDKRMHLCYAFEFLAQNRADSTGVKVVFDKLNQVAPDASPCWAFSNHDVQRHASRWNLNDQAQRAYAMLILSMQGTVCLYQGEELGLEEAEIAFEDLQDPYGIEFWPNYKGRDGCRTPMPWKKDAPFAAFSSAKPWLPVDKNHLNLAVDQQLPDPNSMLHFFKKAIGVRQSNRALLQGTQSELTSNNDVLSFKRLTDDQHLLCVFNLGNNARSYNLDTGTWHSVACAVGGTQITGNKIDLPAWGFALLERIRD